MIVRYDFSRTCFPSQWLNSEYSELSFECDECIASFSLLPRRASNFQSVGNSSSANSLAFSWLLTGLLMKTLHKQRQQKYTKIQVWDQNKDALFHVLFLHLACTIGKRSTATWLMLQVQPNLDTCRLSLITITYSIQYDPICSLICYLIIFDLYWFSPLESLEIWQPQNQTAGTEEPW